MKAIRSILGVKKVFELDQVHETRMKYRTLERKWTSGWRRVVPMNFRLEEVVNEPGSDNGDQPQEP